ncbi:MAG: hypothetical protein AAF356_12210 [Planctomycetota bacterium]
MDEAAEHAPPTAPGALGKPPRAVRRDAHLRPPRWLTVWAVVETVAAVVWLVFALLEFTKPGTSTGGTILFFLLGLPLAMTWCVRAMALVVWAVRDKPNPRRCVLPGLLAGLVPFIGFLGAASLGTDEDFVWRFSMLDDKLAARADEIRKTGKIPSERFRVGLMRIERSHLLEDGTVMFVLREDYAMWFTEHAVAHVPNNAQQTSALDIKHPDAWMASDGRARRLDNDWLLLSYSEEF